MTIEKATRESLISAGFTPNDLLLIGVSGGPDSLVLAHILYSMGWKIAIAHFDHQLRPQSASDCEFVKQTAANFKVDFYQAAENIEQRAEMEKRSIEETARNQRYRFLFAIAQKINAKAVLTAHTTDDQVETILMHLLRGSGTRGLTGMRICGKTEFHTEIPLVRPLLQTWREEIEQYCLEHGLKPVQDASNQEHKYFRNRIRHELIPNLETYNPSVKGNLIHLAEIVQDDWDFLEKQYVRISDELIHQTSKDLLEIPREEFFKLDRGAQKAVLQCALRKLQHNAQVTIEHDTVIEIIQFAYQPTATRHITLPAHLHAFLEGQNLILTRFAALPLLDKYPQISENRTLSIHEPFELKLTNDFLLIGAIVPVSAYQEPQSTAGLTWEAFLDAKQIKSDEVSVRTFHPGERYTPLGMNGKKIKVSDLFTNKKIPVPFRKNWPLILIENEIVWIPGFQPAHAFRIQESTRSVWHLSLKKIK
ncbi:MAG: tRNA lysidine(34) synthetase TilS [Anaerolineaceae bacterium]